MQPSPLPPVPESTAAVAHAAFRKGNRCVRLRDELGALYEDADFAALFPTRGRRALPPWRLALVTVLQFLEGLSDRQAAEAVRSRIDWKYALALELSDPGFDRSVLSEFRARLVASHQELLLLDRMLARFTERGLLKMRGRQRTDSTHVLAAVRVLNRLELVGETLRAALNAVATAAPDWLRAVAPQTWYDRYAHRVENYRLPEAAAERDAYGRTVGIDGYALLDAIDGAGTPTELAALSAVATLRAVWARHFERPDRPPGQGGEKQTASAPAPTTAVRLRDSRTLLRAAEGLESPYDVDARFRTKRGTGWTGYMVHLSETCDADDMPYLITHVDTTPATDHEATRTDAIHGALAAKGLPPDQHLVDAAYVSAALLVSSRQDHRIDLAGPPRPMPMWRRAVDGFGPEHFRIDWTQREVVCPAGRPSMSWREYAMPAVHDGLAPRPYLKARFSTADCTPCALRARCISAGQQGRQLSFLPEPQQRALDAARAWQDTEEGRRLHNVRAGVEGTLSQAVRAFGLRRARYRGLAKVRVQHAATAAALNLARVAAWLDARPRAATRTSRFARLVA